MTGMPRPDELAALADDELLERLGTAGDTVTEAWVDEFRRRGPRLVGPLARWVTREPLWDTTDDDHRLAPVHGTYLLAALGVAHPSPTVVEALLETMRLAEEYDCEDVLDHLPCMLGEIGPPAVGPCLAVLADPGASDTLRACAAECLGAAVLRGRVPPAPVRPGLLAIMEDRRLLMELRGSAACALLEIATPEDRPALERFAAEQMDYRDRTGASWTLSPAKVAETYADPDAERRASASLREWLDFYRDEHRVERIAQRAAEREDGEWRATDRAAQARAADACRRFGDDFQATLVELDRGTASRAEFVWRAMAPFLILRFRCAPWRWTGFRLSRFLERLSPMLDLAGATPDEVSAATHRVLRFWADQGRLAPDALRDCERVLAEVRANGLPQDPDAAPAHVRLLDAFLDWGRERGFAVDTPEGFAAAAQVWRDAAERLPAADTDDGGPGDDASPAAPPSPT